MNILPMKGIMYEVVTSLHGQGIDDNGRRKPCSDIELNEAECYEAYGLRKGKEMCRPFSEDTRECFLRQLRIMRAVCMKTERRKQTLTGKLPWSSRWGKEFSYDSYVSGSFIP